MKICDHCCGVYEDNVMLQVRTPLPPDPDRDGYLIEYLCPQCNDGKLFCKSCGDFCAGIESFDYSDYPGYCEECAQEFRSMDKDYEDDDEFDDFKY